jgi:hypothetical protein
VYATDHLARIVERADIAVPVIMLVQGTLVSGRLVPRRNYTQWFYENMGRAVGQDPDDVVLANVAITANSADIPDDAVFEELCLQMAQIRSTEGTPIVAVPYLIVQAHTIGAFTAGEQVTG